MLPLYLTISDILDRAYREACKNGTTKSFRAKLDIIGHTDVGKTSLTHRLLGQPFIENKESTEGIATHHVKSHFNPTEMSTGMWQEMSNDSEEIVTKFNNEILKKYAELSTTEGNSKDLKRSELNETELYHKKDDKEPESFVLTEKQGDNKSQEDDEPTEYFEVTAIPEVLPAVKALSPAGEIQHEEDYKVKDTEIAEMSSRTRKKLMDNYKSRTEPSSTSDMDYSIRLWDYGGHTEFLATHHLFLNSECTTLILLDISKGLRSPINIKSTSGMDIPDTPGKFLHYWLNAIHTKDIQNGQEPNIALVLTHKDMIQAPDEEQYIKDFISEVMKLVKGKSYSQYTTNENIFVIDNKTGNEKDFESLRNKVFSMITKQMSWT